MKNIFCFLVLIIALVNVQAQETTTAYPYPAPTKEVDLWLVAGQSNMAGYARPTGEVEPDSRVMFFNNQNEWVVLKNPQEPMFFPHGQPHGMVTENTAMPIGGSGLLLPFAKHILKYTDRNIGFIGIATGGNMTKTWDPELTKTKGDGCIYAQMIKRIKDVGGCGNLKGMIWYQGESDALQDVTDINNYPTVLPRFFDSIRKDTNNPNLPIILVQISRLVPNVLPGLPGKSGSGEPLTDVFGTFSKNWERVHEVQRQTAQADKNIYLVSTVDLYPFADPIHLDHEAYNRLGPRIAEIALGQIYKLPKHASDIELDSVKFVDTIHPVYKKVIKNVSTIKVKFKGVNGKLKSVGRPYGFELRFPKVTPEIAAGTLPIIYEIEFDPNEGDAVLIRCTGPMPLFLQPAQLFYGAGLNPYCNIVDDKDIAIPAFGPIELNLKEQNNL